ncbi:phage antirepressor N-terminal domain-containing protein [Methylobacterium sp. Leaf106]|uniref:phage antirepressor N-terminal domain-containing protein n=1 Tax=Methylobacterium sp. Leaf106 TaxID=1736255 RepID=UPI0006F94684|nr:phage antirepressor N-terminal domain-containing protein [Methylobacterium sp. Leaf106]KQP53543.1 phage P22, antirepressor protein [Methylobacterium sp. Leaf106]
MSKLTTIEFHGDTLFAIEEAGAVRVALKPITDRLGLDWAAQLRRTKRDAILAEGMAIMTIPSPGGAQETATLPLSLLPGWLFGIGANQVKAESRALVLTYQRECHDVLFRHFFAPERHPRHTDTLPFDPAREETVPVKRQLVTEARQTFGARAAGSLWFALGLPIVPEMRATGRQTAMDFTYTAVTHGASPSTRGDL